MSEKQAFLRPASAGAHYVHPSSPAGGCGPGPSRAVCMLTADPAALQPHVRSPAARQHDWQSVPSQFQRLLHQEDRLKARAAKAQTLQELHGVALQVAALRLEYQRARMLQAPEPAGNSLREEIRKVIAIPFGRYKDAVATGLEIADGGLPAFVEKKIADAYFDLCNKMVEKVCGELASKALSAFKEGNMSGIQAAVEAAAKDMLAFMKSHDDELVRAISIAAGVPARDVRRWLKAVLAKGASFADRLAASPWAAVVRLLLTPSGGGQHEKAEMELAFRRMHEALSLRLGELLPEVRVEAADLLKPVPKTASGPALRQG
ncbi:hypothetical protein [Ramlibacter sp.]|uniref:hypothetical protein n=1 Tax=Ramlibacter sp. TaxID=1917967 RepID=UPI002D28D02D|nr:hypothetical protein [Ramlibacter sp.]HYD75928.1 hypothetical protein [Ramlibacter sp.]